MYWSHVSFVSNHWYVNGLVQERHNSIANALELCLSCTNPWMWCHVSPTETLLTHWYKMDTIADTGWHWIHLPLFSVAWYDNSKEVIYTATFMDGINISCSQHKTYAWYIKFNPSWRIWANKSHKSTENCLHNKTKTRQNKSKGSFINMV